MFKASTIAILKRSLWGSCLAAAAFAAAPMAYGAPLSNGTVLTIKQGGVGYPEGTCTGSYIRFLNNAILCYPIGPGTDGGLVVGKSQKSGGQEQAPSGNNAKSGEMVSAFWQPPVYATLATAPMIAAPAHETSSKRLLGMAVGSVFARKACKCVNFIGSASRKPWRPISS